MRRVAVAAALLAVAACSHPVRSGTVRERKFVPAHDHQHSEEVTRQDCGYHYGYNPTNGKYEWNSSCRDVYDHTRYFNHRHPDEWRLLLESCNDKGKCHKGWVSVEHDVYDDHEPGSPYGAAT